MTKSISCDGFCKYIGYGENYGAITTSCLNTQQLNEDNGFG